MNKKYYVYRTIDGKKLSIDFDMRFQAEDKLKELQKFLPLGDFEIGVTEEAELKKVNNDNLNLF